MNDLDAIVEMLNGIQWQVRMLMIMAGVLFGAELCKLYVAWMRSKERDTK